MPPVCVGVLFVFGPPLGVFGVGHMFAASASRGRFAAPSLALRLNPVRTPASGVGHMFAAEGSVSGTPRCAPVVSVSSARGVGHNEDSLAKMACPHLCR